MSGLGLAQALASQGDEVLAEAFGSAIGVTYKASDILLLFGLVPWAKYGAFAGLLAGFILFMVLFLRAPTLRGALLPGALLALAIFTLLNHFMIGLVINGDVLYVQVDYSMVGD